MLIVLFTWLISKSILVPLKNLNEATESISAGNLDFQLSYKKDNELGRLCAAFDTMRVKLKESLEKQAAYEKSRKELVADISHDLRTPISSIKGYVEGLQDGMAKDPQMFQRYLTVIQDKTHKLDRLIDDLFQYSQMELGKLSMDFSKQDSEEIRKDIGADTLSLCLLW